MELLISLVKALSAIAVLCIGLYLGWNHDPELEFSKKVPFMFAVLLSTFSPVGLGMYVYFWELNPRLSSACAKQGWLGLLYIAVFRMFAGAFPHPTW